MDNLVIYNKLREVPENAKKSFSNGVFSGTDINPMWRIKRLTEIFGACGQGWYFEVKTREIIDCNVFISINLYYKLENGEWSAPVYGEGGNKYFFEKNGVRKYSDEAFKMALTDAIGNASKNLGLGADVWFASDATKYTNFGKEMSIEDYQQKLVNSANIEELKQIWNTIPFNFKKELEEVKNNIKNSLS